MSGNKKYKLIGIMANKKEEFIHVAILKKARYSDHCFRIYSLQNKKAVLEHKIYIDNFGLKNAIERQRTTLKKQFDLFFDEILILPIVGKNLIRIFVNNEEDFYYYQIVSSKGKATKIVPLLKKVSELENQFNTLAISYNNRIVYNINQEGISIKKLLHNIFYWTETNKSFHSLILNTSVSEGDFID